MKKRIWIGIGAIAAAILAWAGYQQFIARPRSLSALIPADALLVFDSQALQAPVSMRALRTQMPLRKVPVFQEALQNLERFFYSAADTATARAFLARKVVRYSLHPISKTQLGFVFYIPLDQNSDPAFLEKIRHPDQSKYRMLARSFSDERIQELVSLTNQSYGTFFATEHFLIGSSSGVLVENVIRTLHKTLPRSEQEINFRIDADHVAGLSIRPEVMQALFEQPEAKRSLVNLFLPEKLSLQFRQSASRTHLIGYAADDIGNRQDIANIFVDQTPVRIQSGDVIPQNTAVLYHLGLSNPARFGQSMARVLGSTSNESVQERIEKLEEDLPGFFNALGQDVILCRLESAVNANRKIIILKAKDVRKLSTEFQNLAFLTGAKGPSTVKTFLKHKLLRVNVPELPASLFSNLFSGFPQSWITQHGNYLLIANGEDVMQDYLQQLDRKAVWATDPRQLGLLNQILRPANFTAFVRVNRSQTTLPASWPITWRNLLGYSAASLNNLENMVYQASYGNEKVQSTLVLGRSTRQSGSNVLNRLLLRRRVEFNAPLIAAPVVSGNLADGSAQFYAQNNAGQFVLVTPEGDKIVQDTTDGAIRSNIVAADYLSNGRLQYLFMTARKLYVADPNPDARTVKLRSITLPAGIDPSLLLLPRGSRQSSLIALAAHKDGHIYALDRQKKAFTRLIKNPHPGPLLLPFQLIDEGNGMEILALQADGTLHRWHDDGTYVTHFPAKLTFDGVDKPFVSPVLQPAGSTMMQAVTTQGEVLDLHPNGLIAKRSQLYRPIRDGSFRLFPDAAQTNWLLLRTTDTETAILDQQGNLQLDIRGLKPGESNVRYHRLGTGVELISIKSGGFTDIYTLNRRKINDRPIPSDFPVVLQLDEQTGELYILSGISKAVQLFSIRIR